MITFTDNNNKEISIYVANTYLSRLLGLFSSKASKQHGVMISPCNSIHTLFFFKKIDIIFLDKNKKILKTVNSLKPFRLQYCKGAYYALELFSDGYEYDFVLGEYFDV